MKTIEFILDAKTGQSRREEREMTTKEITDLEKAQAVEAQINDAQLA